MSFSVTTARGAWSWRCLIPGCHLTRNSVPFAQFASSMKAHVAVYHPTTETMQRPS